MKILIVGGAGYIGSVLIPELLDRGYDVSVIDLLWFGNNLPKGVPAIKKDIFHLTVDDLREFHQVIFLAGLSNDPMAEYSPAENFISNAAAPAYLGYIAKQAGVKRFIYAGSCSVYGYTVNELYDETSPAVSNYPYGISKLQGENAVIQMIDKNFSVIALRQGTVSGYSPRMRLDLVVNTMFKSAVTDKVITINNPAIWRPILAIKDAAAAYTRAIEANQDISGVFNVASGNYTVGEIGDLVKSGAKKYLNIDVKLHIKHVEDFRNYKVSIEKANKILSFHPQHSIESIIQDLVENQDKFKNFNDDKYYNIRIFKSLNRKI
jgi:nucleoside-diphosphate-sugar epimerase